MTGPAPGQLSVHCYHCGQPVQVGRKTTSTSCSHCHRRLVVEDVVIARLTPVKQVRTCGRLTVKAKGRLLAELVQANGGIEMEGHLQATVISGGPVRIGPKATWKGDLRAPSIAIEGGARIEGGRFAVPRAFPDDADLLHGRAVLAAAGADAPGQDPGARGALAPLPDLDDDDEAWEALAAAATASEGEGEALPTPGDGPRDGPAPARATDDGPRADEDADEAPGPRPARARPSRSAAPRARPARAGGRSTPAEDAPPPGPSQGGAGAPKKGATFGATSKDRPSGPPRARPLSRPPGPEEEQER